MAYTKRELVRRAFSRIGLASYVYDLQPEEWRDAVLLLDEMMAEWNIRGIRINWPAHDSHEDVRLDEVLTIPDQSYSAIVCHLAIRLAPIYGKTIPMELARAAHQAYNALAGYCAQPEERSLGGTALAGAGNRPLAPSRVFLPHETPLSVGSDDVLEIGP
jgi:P22 tail accessory factor